MTESVLSNETPIRLGFFIGVLVTMALWELAAPKRVLVTGKLRRWGRNLGLVAVNTVVLRVSFPVMAVGVAVLVAAIVGVAVGCSLGSGERLWAVTRLK